MVQRFGAVYPDVLCRGSRLAPLGMTSGEKRVHKKVKTSPRAEPAPSDAEGSRGDDAEAKCDAKITQAGSGASTGQEPRVFFFSRSPASRQSEESWEM